MKKPLITLVRGAILVLPVLALAACAQQKAAETPMGPTLEEVAAKADAAMTKADEAMKAAQAAEEAANRAADAAERVEAMFQKAQRK